MSILLKRSQNQFMPQECPYRCCTPLHGKDTKSYRRAIKRTERAVWKRELRNNS